MENYELFWDKLWDFTGSTKRKPQKNCFFLLVRQLRGGRGVKAGPLRKKNFFEIVFNKFRQRFTGTECPVYSVKKVVTPG